MTTRKNPDTSMSAYKAVTQEMKKTHQGKIISALQVLGVASMEKIAEYLGMELNQVTRRMIELERDEIVWKPSKTKTKSGRACYQYQLTGVMPKTENEVKEALSNNVEKKEEKIKQPTKYVEQSLF